MSDTNQSQQSARQASIRAVTGSAESYEGDWMRLFTLAGISAGSTDTQGVYLPRTFDERLLLWINLKLSTSYTNLPEAQQALAAANGAYNWSSLGSFDASAGAAPTNTVAPVASGTATVGSTLSTTNGTWTGSPTSYTYQWKRDGSNIASATAATYLLVTADLGALISCAVTAMNATGSASATSNSLGTIIAAAPFATLNANGATADYSGTPPTFSPNTSPVYFTVDRAGFDTSGSAATIRENLIILSRLNQAYPNQASKDATRVGLQDVVYADDTIFGGATNSSTKHSPPPVAAWAMPDGLLVGGTLNDIRIVAFHRDARAGKQTACAKITVSDGSTTLTFTSSSHVVSPRTGDIADLKIIEYVFTGLDISTLNDGAITLNGKVYPWFGTSGAGSIADSTGSAVAREFSPRTFYKNTARSASYPVCYVYSGAGYTGVGGVSVPTGVDATGKWSLTPATAAAFPFLTIKGALDAINDATRGAPAQTGFLLGDAAGCEIRLGPGNYDLVSTVLTKTNSGACFRLTYDTTQTKSACVAQQPATQWSSKAGRCHFYNLAMKRTGSGFINANVINIYENVDLDNNSVASTWNSNAAGSGDMWFGGNITNVAGAFNQQTIGEHRIWRGVTVPATTAFEAWWVLGCRIGLAGTSGLQLVSASKTLSGSIVAFNDLRSPSSTTNVIAYGVNEATSGAVFAQNVVETTHITSSTRAIGISPDAATLGNTHIILHNNTFTGFGSCGRENLFYDWATSAARTSDMMSVKGNIFVQTNTKSDVFSADGTRTGNWTFEYGCGCAGNYSMYSPNSPAGEAQYFPGLSCNMNITSTTVPTNTMASLFTDYKGTVSAAVQGAGGGTYTTPPGAATRGMLPVAVLSYDRAGTARAALLDNAGALV